VTYSRTAAIALAATIGGFALTQTAAAEVCRPDSATSGRYQPVILHFDTGSTAVKPEDQQKLAEMAKVAKASKVQQICIKGFADKQGDPAMNKKLSQARAQAVAAEFGKLGIGPDYLAMTGEGEPGGQFFASTEGKSESDRRVEVRIAR
jgi:outer membrane protein OmpA-like peptidoglycan-associated protein